MEKDIGKYFCCVCARVCVRNTLSHISAVELFCNTEHGKSNNGHLLV